MSAKTKRNIYEIEQKIKNIIKIQTVLSRRLIR